MIEKFIQICPMCEAELKPPAKPVSGGMVYEFDCLRCGSFALSREVYEDLPSFRLDQRTRAALSYAIRRAQRGNERPLFTSDVVEEIARHPTLPTPREQVDNLLRWVGDNMPAPGESININFLEHRAIAGAVTDDGWIFVVREMLKEELVQGTLGEYKHGTSLKIPGSAAVTLTFKGWDRYEALRRGGTSGYTAFMAMKFGDAELDSIVNVFRCAVEATGFTLRRLDDNPTAGLIDDRLRVEIRASRFLIADLTHANLGAYWEAGFAEGLAKPVIYTCKNSVFLNRQTFPHFDTTIT